MANGGVVVMPSPGDEIAQIFQQLGAAIPTIFNREGLERQALMDQIRANPALGQQIASQVRGATAAGAADARSPGLSSIGAMLGLDMGNPESQQLLASIEQSFPSTLDEQLSALATGSPEAANASPMAQLLHQYGLSQAQAGISGFETDILKNMNEQELERIRSRLNTPALLAQYERITAEAGIRGEQEAIDAWGILDQFAAEHPEYQWAMAAGLNNTPFLDYMKFLQQMSLEERLAAAKNAADPLEALAALLSIQSSQAELFSQHKEMLAAGNDEDAEALNRMWGAYQGVAQELAGAIGIELPTITFPGSEESPITYSPPEKWTERTSTLGDARLQAALDEAYATAVTDIGNSLLHLEPGTVEFSQEYGRLFKQVMGTPLWEYLNTTQLVGEFRNEVVNYVREQLGIRDSAPELPNEEGTRATVQQFQQELSRN